MSHKEQILVEFFGGPLDGHIDAYSSPMQRTIVIRTGSAPQRNSWIARICRLVSSCWRDNLVAISVYKLRQRNQEFEYSFFYSAVESDTQAEINALSVIDDTIGLHRCETQKFLHEVTSHRGME